MRVFYKNDNSYKTFDLLSCELNEDHLRIFMKVLFFRREHIIPRRDISNWAITGVGPMTDIEITCGRVHHTVRSTNSGNINYLNWWYHNARRD